jgi:hypothetical protein
MPWKNIAVRREGRFKGRKPGTSNASEFENKHCLDANMGKQYLDSVKDKRSSPNTTILYYISSHVDHFLTVNIHLVASSKVCRLLLFSVRAPLFSWYCWLHISLRDSVQLFIYPSQTFQQLFHLSTVLASPRFFRCQLMTCSLGLYKKRWVTTVAARPAVWADFRKYFRRYIDFRKYCCLRRWARSPFPSLLWQRGCWCIPSGLCGNGYSTTNAGRKSCTY